MSMYLFAGARTLRCGCAHDPVHARCSDLPRGARRGHGNLHAGQGRTSSYSTQTCGAPGRVAVCQALTWVCRGFGSCTNTQAAQYSVYQDNKPRTKQAFDAFVADHLAKGDPLKGGRLTVPFLRSEPRPMKNHAHVVDLVGNTYDSCEYCRFHWSTYAVFIV